MTRLEKLEDDIYNSSIDVWEVPPGSAYLDGRMGRIVYVNGQHHIFIRDDLDTRTRYCILAHEYGHFITGTISIDVERNESRAWQWAYKRLAPEKKIIKLIKNTPRGVDGAYYLSDIAEELEVTEWFLSDAIDFYSGNGSCRSAC